MPENISDMRLNFLQTQKHLPDAMQMWKLEAGRSFDPRFSEMIPRDAAKVAALFERMGESTSMWTDGLAYVGVAAMSLKIIVVSPSFEREHLLVNERFKHEFYYAVMRLQELGFTVVIEVGPQGRNSLSLSLPVQVIDFTAWGLDAKAFDVIGWGRAANGRVAPVVDSPNAPVSCIQRADVDEWFELGDELNDNKPTKLGP